MAKKQNKTLAKVYHYDLYGKRQEKYDFLKEHSVADIDWNELDYKEPYFFFVPKDFELEYKYHRWLKINDLFPLSSSGFTSERDSLTIKFSKHEINSLIADFNNLEKNRLIQKYQLRDTRDWTTEGAINDVKEFSGSILPRRVNYRPFDFRFTFYTGNTRKFIGTPSYPTMKHLLKDNLAIITCKQQSTFDFAHIFITNIIVDRCVVSSASKETGYVCPLYLYPETETDGMYAAEGLSEKGRKPNLNPEIVAEIAAGLGLEFENEKTDNDNTFAPIDILDYIYAVLHSPTYREKYKEFLKIDFPRVPYPKDAETFWQLVKLGGELRQIHLLESPKTEDYITSYPKDGSNQITRRIVKKDWEIVQAHGHASQPVGRIWINDEQYFDNIPLTAWEFYIGGYQPAQKWLKDRAPKKGQPGRILTYEDIRHYQKIIVALTETDRLMGEIDEIEIE
jgi:predicted helicase